jgi:hypothetical protein
MYKRPPTPARNLAPPHSRLKNIKSLEECIDPNWPPNKPKQRK